MELSQLEVYFAKYGKQNVLDLYNAYRSDLYRSSDEIWREFALKFKVVTKGTKYVSLRKSEHLANTRSVYTEDLQLSGRKPANPYMVLTITMRNGNNQAVLVMGLDIEAIEKEIKENVN